MGHVPARHLTMGPRLSRRLVIAMLLAAPRTLEGQIVAMSARETRADGGIAIGVSSYATSPGSMWLGTLGVTSEYTAGEGPWYFGGAGRLWLTEQKRGTSGVGAQLLGRVVRQVEGTPVEAHGGVGLGVQVTSSDRGTVTTSGSDLGFVLDAGILYEYRRQANLGFVFSADVTTPPLPLSGNQVGPRGPMLVAGIALRRHGLRDATPRAGEPREPRPRGPRWPRGPRIPARP